MSKKLTHLDANQIVKHLLCVNEVALKDENQAFHDGPADEIDGHSEGKEEKPSPDLEIDNYLQ